MALPATVKMLKMLNFIRSAPAGREMRLRTPGISRPKDTADLPCRANHAAAFSKSSR